MYCENCGAEISDKAKFCKECGVNLSNGHNNVNNEENSSFGENKFCFECGADVSEDIKFCSSCGASLTGIGDVESKKELISKPVSLDNTKNDNTTKNKDNKKFKINNKYLAIGGLILLILILGSFLIMELSKPPEVTYENYPDIPKKVIDRFNELDLNNDTFIIPGEYGGKGYPSVWYALEGEGYANHTVKYDDSDVPAMDVNDYNRAYNVEQKLIKEEKAKIDAENKKQNQEWEQAYQNWYSRHGNPNLDDSQNRIRFQNDVASRVYGPSYSFGLI